MTGKLNIEVIGNTSGSFATSFASPSGDGHKLVNNLTDVLSSIAGGHTLGHVRVRVDDSAPTTATATVAVTYANLAAGDQLILNDTFSQTIFTCVTTVPVSGDNTFQKVTDATATGTSLKNCINNSPQMRGRYTATDATGTVTITALGYPGSLGNVSNLQKQMANGAGLTLTAFVGGRDAGSTQTLKATLGANPTNTQTFLLGAKTITFVTASANQDQVTIGADATATALALVAILNANTDLNGFFVAASVSAGVISVELRESGQIGRFISVGGTATSLAWVNLQTGVTATDFRPTTTEVNKVLTQGVTIGYAAKAL
jgi:hypothetical protein